MTSTTGPASSRAAPLAGPISVTFGVLACKHKAFIVVPMDLAEAGPEAGRLRL